MSELSPETDHAIRCQLWFSHGCGLAALYGDDGEMQCGRFHPCIDFKRSSFGEILKGIESHNQRRAAEYAASAFQGTTYV